MGTDRHTEHIKSLHIPPLRHSLFLPPIIISNSSYPPKANQIPRSCTSLDCLFTALLALLRLPDSETDFPLQDSSLTSPSTIPIGTSPSSNIQRHDICYTCRLHVSSSSDRTRSATTICT